MLEALDRVQILHEKLRISYLGDVYKPGFEYPGFGFVTDIKDASLVKVPDETDFHYEIYGTFGTSRSEAWVIGRLATEGNSLIGGWRLLPPARIDNPDGGQVCAPFVSHFQDQEHPYQMLIQQWCFEEGGHIMACVSKDGQNFIRVKNALEAVPGGPEGGLYDPSSFTFRGIRYMLYSGFPVPGYGDLYIAQSVDNSLTGPYKRLGQFLSQYQVPFHNQIPLDGILKPKHLMTPEERKKHEWGLEGVEAWETPKGSLAFIFVYFEDGKELGLKQRIGLGTLDRVGSIPIIHGSLFEPAFIGCSGEVGHPSVHVENGIVYVVFQYRDLGGNWGYKLITFENSKVDELVNPEGETKYQEPTLPFAAV